jgi:hypothetical protein
VALRGIAHDRLLELGDRLHRLDATPSEARAVEPAPRGAVVLPLWSWSAT